MNTPHATETSIRLNQRLSAVPWSRSIGCWLTLVALLVWNPTRTLAQQPAFLTEGLVAYYPFNGNANDESGNQRNGIPINLAFGVDRFGNTSSAGFFSEQTPAAVDLPEPIPSFGNVGTSATFSIWFKGKSLNYGDAFLLSSRLEGRPIFCDIRVSQLNKIVTYFADVAGFDGYRESVVSLDLEKWNNVTVTIDYNSIKHRVFINGELDTEYSYNKGTSFISSNTRWRIGSRKGEGLIGTFFGLIDDVRIYNRALSDSEVKSLYAFESVPPNRNFLTNGLVAYYPFNGNANDGSGNGKNGTPFSLVSTNDRFGTQGKAYSFSSQASSYIALPEIDASIGAPKGSFSISAWVKSNNRSGNNHIIAATDSNAYQMPRLEIRSNLTVGYYHRVPNINHEGGGTAKINTDWNHILYITDGQAGLGRLFINGVEDLSFRFNFDPNIDRRDAKRVWAIGNTLNTTCGGCNPYFDGVIDDLRIYNRSLSEAEVKALYKYESTPPDNSFLTNGLVAYYPFNGNANDESGDFDGSIVGGVNLTSDRFGKANSAYSFSRGYIDCGSPGVLAVKDNFTLSVWCSFSGNSMINPRILSYANKGFELFTWGSGAVRSYGFFCGGPGFSTEKTFGSGAWNLVTVVVSNQFAKLFVNGDLAGAGLVKIAEYDSYKFLIGRNSWTAQWDWWEGLIDDVRIYNRALPDAEVAALYAYESAPPIPTVVTAPADQTLIAGQTLSLTAQISGSNLSYRWQKNGADLADGGRIAGATTPTLTITGVTPVDAGQYRLTASNANGNAATAEAAVTVQVSPDNRFLTNGLVAYYPFNGNANDESGNGIHGVVEGPKLCADRFQLEKGAYSFNGASQPFHPVPLPIKPQRITVKPKRSFLNGLTFSAWVLSEIDVKQHRGDWYIFGSGINSRRMYGLRLSSYGGYLSPNGLPTFFVENYSASGSQSLLSHKAEYDPSQGKWVHVVYRVGEKLGVFLDGALINSITVSSPASDAIENLVIGDFEAPESGMCWLGRIDDVRIYNRALSDAEVAALYAYESAPPVPTVVMAPADQTLIADQTLSLTAQIRGQNLSYRWQKNGVDLADGGRISGAATPTLTITGVTPADAGQYRLTASNANGSATTAAATVTVQAPPAITQQPQSADGIEGESVTLQVVAVGSPEPTFQWFKNGTALAGQTAASLVLSPLQDSDAGTYRVDVRNAAGTLLSAEAVVTVTPAIQVLVGGTPVRDVVRTVTPVRVELRFAQSDWFLFYTLDGTDPDFLSRPYVGPFDVASAGELRTIAYSADFSTYVRGRPVAFRFLQPQVIDWGVLPVVRYGDRVPLGVKASSGLPVGVTVVSGPAQIVEGQLRATGVGAVLLRAVQAGSDLFSAVTSEQSLNVDKALQTLTWPTVSNRTFGDAPFGVGVTSSSGLPVVLSVVSGKATVSGLQVTLKGAGGVVLRASQAGTDLYLPTSEERSFTVAKGNQTVTFPALADRPYTTSVIALSAGTSSGLPVAYEVVGGPAQIESGGLRLTGVGRVVVRATQPGNDDYLAAAFVDRAFEVTRGTQTITFTPIGSKTFGDPPVTLQATASSGLPVTFRVNSGPGVVEGSQLTLSGAGTVVVQAIQAGDANWAPATAAQSVPVAKAVQTLTFQPLPNRGYTTALIPLVASSSSGLSLTYRVVSGPATLVGTDLKLTGVGTVQVAADQAGDANHQPASATASFVVSRGEQTLTFDPIGDQVLGGGPITLRATSSAGLPVAFLVVSGPATVQDNQLMLTAEGTVVVRARQVGSPLWLSAQQDQTFRVLKVTTLTLSAVTGGSIGVDPVKAQYQPTESVTLTAVAAEGYQFGNWTGDLSGSANPATLAMSASRTVGAIFKDVAAPGVSWDLPLAGSTGNELVVLVGRVTDNVAGITATWRRDAGEAVPLPLAADGSFRVDGVKLSMGDNRFTLTARDVAGNVTTAERVVTWVPERVLQVATATEVQEGQRMIYPLQLVTDAENVAGLSFRLTYDPTYLADPQVEWSGLVGQSVNNVNVGTPGEVGGSFALAGVALPVGTNPVASVSFRARSVPFVQNVALTPRIVSLSTPAGVALTTGNAAVAGSGRVLTRKIRGDNNANQRIDVGDAVVISRLEVGLEPVRSWDIALNDLNDTKTLDTGDVVRALRVVVGLDPQPKAAPRSGGGSELSVESGALRVEAGGADAPESVGGTGGTPDSVSQLSTLHSQPGPRSLRPAGSNTNDVATLEFPDGPVAQVGKPYRVVVKLTRAGAAIAGLSFTVNYPSALTVTDKQVGALVPSDALPLWAESAGSVNLAAVRSTIWPTSTGVAAVLTFLPTAGIGAQATWPIELVKGEVTGAGFDIRALDNVVGQIRSSGTPSSDPKVVVPTLPTDGGPLALDIEAAAGAAIVLETTTDLGSWSEAQRLTGQGAGKPVRVTVTPDPNARVRFWRVRVP